MGSIITVNDTLQLTKKQSFPKQLDVKTHLVKPYLAKQFKEEVFEFKNKDEIRIYKAPPVRNFLVENTEGKWIYWGLVHVLEINHDYVKRTTSGKFRIIYIYTPLEMKKAHSMIDRVEETDYFKSS